MQLSPRAVGLSFGIVMGVGLMAVTLMVMAQGGGGQLSKLHRIFPGYSVSVAGSFIGLVYGFICGIIDGGIMAVLYNIFAGTQDGKKAA